MEAHAHTLHTVHVTAVYTATAEGETFTVPLTETVAQLIEQAYRKVKETRRDTDRFFCLPEPRTDLAPHMHDTLATLRERGIGVRADEDEGGKLGFVVEIETETGGAA